MRSNYKRLGPYIREVDVRNSNLAVKKVLGVNVGKVMMDSKANLIGTDMSKYKVVKENQFVYGPVTSRNGERIAIARCEAETCIVSVSYTVFEIINPDELLPEYIMMWFRRPEFDRYARYMSHGSVRELFGWEEISNIELPVPSPEKQQEIVAEYRTVVDRISLNKRLNEKLEEVANAIYRHWFIDFEFPMTASQAQAIGKPELEGQSYKSSGGELVYNETLDQEIPVGWEAPSLGSICSKIGSGATPKGGKDGYKSEGVALVRSLNIYDFGFESKDLARIDEDQAAKLNNVELETDDVLINITGVSVARCTILPSHILPGRVNQHVAILRLDAKHRFPHYLMCLLCSSRYKSRLLGDSESGSTRQALTKGDLESFNIMIPSQETGLAFEQTLATLFTLKFSKATQLDSLDSFQQILLASIASKYAQ